MKWFRMYDEVLDDPKVQRLRPELFKVWINLLCLANRQKERGTLPRPDDIAFSLRMDRDAAHRVIGELEDVGLVGENEWGLWIHNWDERQYHSDTPEAAAERKRRQRDRERERHSDVSMEGHADVAVTERDSHSVVTPPEQIQSRTDTEQKQSRDGAPQADARAAPKPKPKQDELWDALVSEVGAPATQAERGKYNAALKQLRAVNAKADDIRLRCERYRAEWPDVELTPMALVNNWSRFEQARSNGKPQLQAVTEPPDPDEAMERRRADDKTAAEWRASEVRNGDANKVLLQLHKWDVERGLYPRLEVQA